MTIWSRQFRGIIPFAPVLLILLSACGDSSGPRPVPARVDVDGTPNLSATVNQPVTPVPSVVVRDSKGRPVANVGVSFSASDGGTVGMPTVRTDAKGVASAGSWTLGTRAGTQTLTATIPGLAPVVFHARAAADLPATVHANTSEFEAVAGSTITVPEVKVADRYGNGVPGVVVRFTITNGPGAAVVQQALTDSLGIARAGSWTLSTVAGPNILEAVATGLETAPLVFRVNGSAGPATRLVVEHFPAIVHSGLGFISATVVRVADQHGNGVRAAGVTVNAQLTGGDATLTATSVSTDDLGLAAFQGMMLTGRAGSYTVRFSAVGLMPVDVTTQLLGGRAAKLALVTAPPAAILPGIPFPVQPVIELRDAQDNLATEYESAVNVSLESGTGVLNGNLSAHVIGGRAAFVSLGFMGSGIFRLRFTSGVLPPLISAELSASPVANCTPETTIVLDYALGQTARFRTDSIFSPRCLSVNRTRNTGQQYLVMFEHMPPSGGFGSALFPGFDNTGAFVSSIATAAAGSTPPAAAIRPAPAQQPLPPGLLHSWNFGGNPIYELQPTTPPELIPQPKLTRVGGDAINASAAVAVPVPGDTLVVHLEPIPRLGIPAGTQKAVVRHVTDQLVFAEDVRLGTVLRRQSGGFNRPLTIEEMDSIARLYAAEPLRQADRLFDDVYNAATTAQQSRIIAVHTLMPADNIWGYTYPNTNVFAYDFWVASDGQNKTVNQSAVRLAHNLFMHEIAHTRHIGLLERAGRTNLRGNLWLVEGFARFTERLPIASYLLRQDEPSRTANYVLGTYPNINPPSREDVPVYLNMGAPVIAGYAASSYIFDYLADQVAAGSGDWRATLRQFLMQGGNEASLDAAVAAALPGVQALSLFTRARLALYMDDSGIAGLPQWTQYLQYDLRASRPPLQFADADPRNAWSRIVPGLPFSDRRSIPSGGAYGYIIDGAAVTEDASITLDPTAGPHGIVSITRIR